MPDKISERLAQEIVNSGYQVVSDSEINEMRDAIRQREITTMTMKQKKLVALQLALENLIERIFANSDAVMLSLFVSALDLAQNIQDALDELNSDLHLERYPN